MPGSLVFFVCRGALRKSGVQHAIEVTGVLGPISLDIGWPENRVLSVDFFDLGLATRCGLGAGEQDAVEMDLVGSHVRPVVLRTPHHLQLDPGLPDGIEFTGHQIILLITVLPSRVGDPISIESKGDADPDFVPHIATMHELTEATQVGRRSGSRQSIGVGASAFQQFPQE